MEAVGGAADGDVADEAGVLVQAGEGKSGDQPYAVFGVVGYGWVAAAP
jgi:hypothetical protein